jgi:exosome complex component RRP42
MGAIDIVKTAYIKQLMSTNLREDGRGFNDSRDIKITTGILQNAEGSAQVDIGSTRVLAGVKLDLGEPMEDTPNEGTVAMSADLLPLASADFEMGPPSPEAIELARVVDRGIRAGKCVDMASLFLEEGKAWNVFVDIYVLNYDGNLFDASEIAAMSALLNTKVPEYVDGKVVREKRIKALKIDNIVTSVTVANVADKILIDPTGGEEEAADARLTIATDGKYVRAMQKGLGGSFTQKEILDAAEAALNRHGALKQMIEKTR